MGARWLDRIGSVHRRLWEAAGTVAIGAHVWHLTVLSLMVGLITVGSPTPDRLTVAWWVGRWAAVVGPGCWGSLRCWRVAEPDLNLDWTIEQETATLDHSPSTGHPSLWTT